jgi:hypothetical protein
MPGGTRHRLLVTAEDLTNFSIPMCKTLFSHLLFSLVYVVLLMLIVAMLAVKTHGIKDNYRESTYIAIAIGASIPITLGWILCAMVVPERHRDACLAFGLVATSGTVFIVMFMPKGRQLAAMGKEGLYSEDKIDQVIHRHFITSSRLTMELLDGTWRMTKVYKSRERWLRHFQVVSLFEYYEKIHKIFNRITTIVSNQISH